MCRYLRKDLMILHPPWKIAILNSNEDTFGVINMPRVLGMHVLSAQCDGVSEPWP